MRECHIYIVVGRQGVGKTHHMLSEAKAIVNGNGKTPRKVLVFDCNVASGSYSQFKTIDYNSFGIDPRSRCKSITEWTKPDVRRVVNYRKDGNLMGLDEMNTTALDLMECFSDGMLVLEDMNVYLTGAKQKRFISEFVRVRHKNVDLVLIVQTLRALDPKMWANCSMLRMHKTFDNVDTIKDKIPDQYEMLKISQLIVNEQYQIGNHHFFLYVNMRNGKIIGCSLNTFKNACVQYIALNPSDIVELSKIRKISRNEAETLWIEMKVKDYFPTPK